MKDEVIDEKVGERAWGEIAAEEDEEEQVEIVEEETQQQEQKQYEIKELRKELMSRDDSWAKRLLDSAQDCW